MSTRSRCPVNTDMPQRKKSIVSSWSAALKCDALGLARRARGGQRDDAFDVAGGHAAQPRALGAQVVGGREGQRGEVVEGAQVVHADRAQALGVERDCEPWRGRWSRAARRAGGGAGRRARCAPAPRPEHRRQPVAGRHRKPVACRRRQRPARPHGARRASGDPAVERRERRARRRGRPAAGHDESFP